MIVRRLIRWLLVALTVVLVVISFAPLIQVQWWFVRLLAFPRAQEAAVIVILAVVTAVLVRPRWFAVLIELSLLAAFLVNFLTLYAYLPFRKQPAAECSEDARLTVIIANVQLGNRKSDRLIKMVEDQNPDLFLAMETDDWWENALKPLERSMPNSVKKVTGSYYGMNLFSRLKLNNSKIRFLADQKTPAIDTGVTLRNGDTIRFLGVHPKPPLVFQSSSARDAQLYAAGLILQNGTRPAVLAGDLNATPWEIGIERMRRIGSLIDPRKGYGFIRTFNAKSWWEKWPLDQIFYTTGFETISLEVLGAFGSDHYPYVVRLCRSAKSSGSVPPALDADDSREAKQVIDAAKNKKP